MKRTTLAWAAVGLALGTALSRSARAAAPNPAVVGIDWKGLDKGYPRDADSQRLLAILRNANKYAVTTWWTTERRYAAQDGAAYLDFGGNGETEIRPPCEEAFALAVSLRLGLYDPQVTGVPQADAEAKARRLIGSVAFHHKANAPGGWGDAWQSAVWASWCGQAGWLLWDQLSPTDRENVRRMVEHEADRFLAYPVPYYQNRAGKIVSPGDTKAEENAWNATILQIAAAMMPRHSHVNAWNHKNIELMLSTFARPRTCPAPMSTTAGRSRAGCTAPTATRTGRWSTTPASIPITW